MRCVTAGSIARFDASVDVSRICSGRDRQEIGPASGRKLPLKTLSRF
ncbi:MAG: hypothetical protein JW989_06295 [Chlorobiaceae bacterium]|nr:hypothetical protein [Chlorobiaceae bacterium]